MPKAASGNPPANRLGEANHVGRDAVVFRGAAPTEFRAGLHFVEDQERAVLRRNLAQALQEAGLRHAQADVHQDRLENNRRDLPGIFLEAALDGAEVIEGCNRHVRDRRLGHAQSTWNRDRILDVAEVGLVRLHADQGRVVQAVIAAFELEDLVAAGCCASEANGVHRGFGAAGAEADHLDREALADFFRKLPFHVVRHAEHGAGGEPLLDGLHHRGMAVTRHQSAEAQVVIDVVVAVEIAEVRALPFFHEDRIGIVSAVVAGDA